MKTIMNLLQSVDLDSKSQKIINGQLDQGLIMAKVSEFNRLDAMQQNAYRMKLIERVKKITKPYKLMTVLLLVDNMMKSSHSFELPHFMFLSLRNTNTNDCLILTTMMQYYHYFLRLNQMNKYNKYVLNVENELNEAQNYCEMAIAKILEFIKNQFIFTSAWNKIKEHRVLFRSIMSSVLERFREDLHIMTAFVKDNIAKVLDPEEHPLALQINYVYEKLILINKEMKKIDKIMRIYDLQVDLPRYEIDLEFNKKLEMAMLSRKEQRREFDVKRIKKVQEQALERRNKFFQEFVLEDIDVNLKTNHNFLLLDDEEQF